MGYIALCSALVQGFAIAPLNRSFSDASLVSSCYLICSLIITIDNITRGFNKW